MDLLRLEQQRQALEHSLQKLRTSLKYWQTFEAEYEGFKEEIEATTGDVDLVAVSKVFPGELVNEKEIRELSGLCTNSPRTVPQILGMISRRQEYVQKNIETVQRQFFDAEAKLEEIDFAAHSANRDSRSSGGLPLTEIHEELDEEGNVISSSLSQPEMASSKLVAALQKAGMTDKDLSQLSKAAESEAEDEDDNELTEGGASALPSAIVNTTAREMPNGSAKSTQGDAGPDRPPIRKKSVSFTADTKPAPVPVRRDSEDGKKCVTFAPKVAVMPSAPPADTRSVSFSPQVEEIRADTDSRTVTFSPQVQEIPAESVATKSVPVDEEPNSDAQKMLRGYFKPGDKVGMLSDDGEVNSTHIVIPENETEEDARLRREMLDYHLNEVGHVVAEMELEDDDIDFEDDAASSEYLDEDTPYTTGHSDSEDDEEDQYGRTTKRVLSDEYHKQMKELEQRLIGNLGPAPAAEAITALDPEIDAQDVRRLVIREKSEPAATAGSSEGSDDKFRPNNKKRVSFAEELDVATESTDASGASHKAQKTIAGNNVAPIVDDVAERTPAAKPVVPSASTPAKASGFKKARAAEPNAKTPEPAPLAGKILADQLFERPASSNNLAPDLDNPDPIVQRRELAAEYYRKRNAFIKERGGFKGTPDEDDAEGEMMESDGEGGVKKMSRFKSARLRGL